MRHMGIGVWWQGTVRGITDDARVSVLFDVGIGCTFDADEHLIPAPATPAEAAELQKMIDDEVRENAAARVDVNQPQWPAGYFGPEKR
jgi:hypothetical protein